jgi:hypothetical protein
MGLLTNADCYANTGAGSCAVGNAEKSRKLRAFLMISWAFPVRLTAGLSWAALWSRKRLWPDQSEGERLLETTQG